MEGITDLQERSGNISITRGSPSSSFANTRKVGLFGIIICLLPRKLFLIVYLRNSFEVKQASKLTGLGLLLGLPILLSSTLSLYLPKEIPLRLIESF